MNILIDTNILISLEPTSPDYVEERTPVAAHLVRVVSEGGNRILMHPESLRELAGDQDPVRRSMRSVLLDKYQRLFPAPPMADALRSILGDVDPASHDYVDHLMLSAVLANAVQFLVTDDGDVIRKASRLGVGDRVFTVEDALALLVSLLGRTPEPPPLVIATKAYDLDPSDPIFDSFREDYGTTFDPWLRRAQLDQRPAWVIREGAVLDAICIIKQEDDELQLAGRTLKICSLKVSSARSGRRYGELLLKTIFRYLHENAYDFAFLTVFERHAGLIALLEDFGFSRHLPDKLSGERFYLKRLRPTDEEHSTLAPLDLHIRFGPPSVRLREDDVFLVPIQPRYHRLLFPDAEPPARPEQQQLELFATPHEAPRPFGNALRKAYLSHTPNRRLTSGSSVLFYRSWDAQAITCVGVVEDTMVSGDATQVAAFVGQRTVYSLEEITQMCDRRDVVAIRFRQDRLLSTPIGRAEMVSEGLAGGPPMSVQRIRPGVIEWLTRRIGE
jgi:ribosomal protein S18 acetylase RimI-like enzyme